MELYNYLYNKLETFVPIHDDHVGMYVCGPTVYGDPHLGHARSALTFDILYRYLEYKGYRVKYIRNITDVGHLEDETLEQGEDKIEKAARLKRIDPMQIAHMYAVRYRQTMEMLNMKTPSIEPLASGHILEQQEYIAELLEGGWAYEVKGNVYFDVKKFIEKKDVYGKLSGKKVDDLLAGQRELKNQDEKKSVLDFALWKTVGEKQVMYWKSPWSSRGVPGWHTECCVMSEKYLGNPFDIHGGGIDLQFPHHEAEIAQSVAHSDNTHAHFWLYNNMVTIDKQKMSKSANNFITLQEFFSGTHERLSQSYSPQLIRFFLLRAHYRSMIDISDEALQGTIKGLAKLNNAMQKSKQILVAAMSSQITSQSNASKSIDVIRMPLDTINKQHVYIDESTQSIIDAIHACMDNDMNTPQLIAELFSLSGAILEIDSNTLKNNTLQKKDISMAHIFSVFFGQVLGLDMSAGGATQLTTYRNETNDIASSNPEAAIHQNKEAHIIDELVNYMIAQRAEARKEKNFALSDTIRDKLLVFGISLKDKTDGTTTWEYT